jgi:hypothetical protein
LKISTVIGIFVLDKNTKEIFDDCYYMPMKQFFGDDDAAGGGARDRKTRFSLLFHVPVYLNPNTLMLYMMEAN